MNIFEYHPPSPPSPSRPPAINHAALPPPSRQPVVYHMATPFVLPDIPVYYEPPHSPPPPTGSQPEYVVIPASRSYGHMESFYLEPPMKHREAYPEAEHVYEANDFSQTWTDFSDALVSGQLMVPPHRSESSSLSSVGASHVF